MANTDDAPRSDEPAQLDLSGIPAPATPFFEGIDWLSFGMAAVAAFGVYLFTLAPEVTLEDGGSFVTGAAYAGVPDCPGFPLWTIYSWVFVKLMPFSNIAWRVAVASAVAAALACGLTALMVSRGGALLYENTRGFANRPVGEQNLLRAVSGCVAGLAPGLSETIWSQVDILNVWALSVLLFAAMLALLMRWTATPQRRGFLIAACFVFGLLLTNSQSMISISPAFLLWVMLADAELGRELFIVAAILAAIETTTGLLPVFESFSYRNVPLLIAFIPAAVCAAVTGIKARGIASEWRSASVCAAVFLAGLGLSFYSAIASMTNPPLNWGYPRTAGGFYHLVSRSQYDKLFPSQHLGQFLGQLLFASGEAGRSLGWLYFVFIPAPFCFLRSASRAARLWMFGLTGAFMCVGPLIVAMLNPTRERSTLHIFTLYLSPLHVVLAVWSGLGIMAVASLISRAKE